STETYGEMPALPIEPEELNFVTGFFRTLRQVILGPGNYFSKNSLKFLQPGGVAKALAFALVVEWFGDVTGFLWRSVAGVVLEKHMSDLFRIAGDVVDQ